MVSVCVPARTLTDETVSAAIGDRDAFAALSEAERDEIEAHLNAKLAAMDPAVLLARAQEMLAYLEGAK